MCHALCFIMNFGVLKTFCCCCFSLFLFSCEKEFGYRRQLLEEDVSLNTESSYMVVLGDIQEYTMNVNNLAYLENTMNWIWSQKQYGKDISCILHVGDITNDNIAAQWRTFYDYTYQVANEILYVTCIGNHDYTWNDGRIYDRSSTLVNEYARFCLTEENIVEYFEYGRIENVVIKNTIFGERYDIIVLEFGPRLEVLKWANDYVTKHQDRKFILMTHEFLSAKGERISKGSFAEGQLVDTSWSSPENVWQNLIRKNDNIVCVLCGHNGFSARLFTKNDEGRDVPQILFNLQYQNHGGDGWIQLWEFPPYEDSVTVSVYNTILREKHPDAYNTFKFRYRY